MKNFLLALMVVLTTCTLAVAQTTVVRDSMQAVIMFRKLLPCLWSRYSGNISRDR